MCHDLTLHVGSATEFADLFLVDARVVPHVGCIRLEPIVVLSPPGEASHACSVRTDDCFRAGAGQQPQCIRLLRAAEPLVVRVTASIGADSELGYFEVPTTRSCGSRAPPRCSRVASGFAPGGRVSFSTIPNLAKGPRVFSVAVCSVGECRCGVCRRQ